MRNLGSIPLWVYEKDLPRAHCENADLYYDRVLPAMRTETRAEYIGCSCKSCGFELQKPAVRPSLESTKFFSLNASTSKKMHTLYDALENQVAQICTENNVSMDGLLQKDMKDIKKTITNLSKACQELFHSSTGVFVGCKTMALPESSSSSSKTKELDHKDEQTIVQTSRVRKNNRTANTTASEYKEEAKVQIPSRVRTKRRHAIVHIDTEQKDAQEEKQVKNTRVDHAAAAAAAVVSSKKSFGSCFICQKEVFDTHSFLSVQCPQHKYYLHRSCRKGICLQGEKSKCLDSKCVYMVTRIESKPVGKSTYIEYENNNVRKYSNNPHIVEVVHLDTIKPQDKKILRDGSILPVERRRRKLGKLQDEEEKIDERNQMNSSSARCKGVLPMLFVSNQDYNEEPKHCHSHYLINNPSDQCFMHHPLCNLRSILCVQ